MNKESIALIELATSKLKIRNITLFESSLSRPTELEVPEAKVSVMEKRGVRANNAEAQVDGRSVDLLLVYVDLGIRLVDADAVGGDEPRIFVQIEATFLVEYELLGDLPEEAIKAFAENNSVHNVWPFWRHHVFDTVQRSGLPHIEVPFFTVTASGSASNDDSKQLPVPPIHSPTAAE